MFGRYAITCRLSFGLTLALLATTAIGAEWRIVEVTGVVRVTEPGRDAAPGRLNAALPVGSSVTTAAGGRASLDNGLQRIVVGPNSRMTIAPETTSGMTRIAQDLGAILFQVDKKKAAHFRVDTPLLAAVVKGTTFTVVVDVQSDTVNVAEGLVEVRSNAGSMSQDVPGGATASVMRDTPQAVKMSAIAASAPDSAPAVIEPLDYGAVSGGLVEVGGLPAGAPQVQQAGPAAAGGRGNQASLGAPPSQIGGDGSMSPATSMVAEQARNAANPTASLSAHAGGAPGLNNGHHGGVGGGAGNGAGDGASPASNATHPGVGNGPGNGNSGGGNGNPASGNSGNGNSGNGNSGNGATTGLNVDAGVAPGNGNSGGGNGNPGNGNGNGNGTGLNVDAGVSLGNGNSSGGNGSSGNGATPGLNVDAGVSLGNGNSGGGNGNSGNGAPPGLNVDAGVSLGNGNGNSGGGTGASGNPGGGGDPGVNLTDPATGLSNGLRVKK